MVSAAIFFFVVVVPIWSAATLVTKWIEAWAEREIGGGSVESLVESVDDMTARIAALEQALADTRGRLASGVG
jgi:hypothetical protein